MTPQESHEQFKLKQIGNKLLSETSIQLQELNAFLKEFSSEKLTARVLLQHLLRQRKINVEVFLDLDQRDWSKAEPASLLYNIRNKSGQFEFYFTQQPQNKKFGEYQTISEIARGGMGVVYKAYHPGRNQTYALKVLIAGEHASEQLLKRFHREVEATSKLIHPGIVQIVDSGEEQGQHYFVMEYVEGKPLNELMKEGLSLREGVKIVEQVLRALHYAHQKGVIHRDLKPENIFATKEKQPKIGDFGLAKDLSLDSESQQITQTGFIVGTPAYMAPEQASGELKTLDARADIYSMGVCLFQLLTSKKPFEGKTVHDLFYKIIHTEVEAPSTLNPDIHPDLDMIVLKAMAKDPAHRYNTAEEFANDLLRFLAGQPIAAAEQKKLLQQLKWGIRLNLALSLLLIGFFIFYLISLFFGEPLFSTKFGEEFTQHAKDSFLNGGEAGDLTGFWQVSWYTEGSTEPHKEVISLDNQGSEILGTATDKTTPAKTYWYHGRISNKNIITLLYWSQYDTPQASLVGVLLLELQQEKEPVKLVGTWSGYSRSEKILQGTVEWTKMD